MIITLLSEMQAPYFPRNKLNSAKKMLQKKYLKNLSEMQASYSQRDKLNSAKKKTYTLPNFVVVIYIYY